MKRAFFACFDKDEHLLRLAKFLYESDWMLTASVGTARYINTRGIPCRDVSETIGPMMLRHRIVTLDRKIYAALLAEGQDDMAELHRIGVQPIGLVYVRLYPIQKTIANPKSTPKNVIEEMDIGGPTILRAAVKGRRLAMCDPSQIDKLENWIRDGCKTAERERLVEEFSAAAETYVAEHVEASANYWKRRSDHPQEPRGAKR